MTRFARALTLAPALLLAQCVPDCSGLWLPPGAYIDAAGCISIDATPPHPRLAYDGATDQWRFDGRLFGTSAEEDECIRPVLLPGAQ